MNEKGVQPPTPFLLQSVAPELARWLSIATAASVKARSYTASVAPGSIAAGTESAVTVTVTGITANDIVYAQKPSRTADVSVMQAIPGTNQVTLVLRNFNAGAVTVPTETYTIFAVRA